MVASTGTRSSRSQRQVSSAELSSSPATALAPRSSLSRQSSRNTHDRSDSEAPSSSSSSTRKPALSPLARIAATSSRRERLISVELSTTSNNNDTNDAMGGDDDDGDRDQDNDEDTTSEAGADAEGESTPTRRSGRGQGNGRGGRGGSRAGVALSRSGLSRSRTKSKDVDVDDEELSTAGDTEDDDGADGKVSKVAVEQEVDSEENEGEVDELGEAKITKDGELLGGRQFKIKTFTMPDRGSRVYMLSMDPARVLGFRDSYLFFIKNPHLVRVITTAEERTWMIREGLLMANFKSKLIALVTARSIFKTFGHRIIKNGRSRVDDYYEAAAMEDDTMDGYASTQVDEGSIAGEDLFSASSRRKRGLDYTDDSAARPITGLNWLHESAMSVRTFNSQLKAQRKEHPRFLDPHTNLEQIPANLQPTRTTVSVISEHADEQNPVIRQQQLSLSASGGTAAEGATTTNGMAEPRHLVSKVISIPRSIGPKVDADVKIEIRAGAPGPPTIVDPSIWAAIPEDIKKALAAAEDTMSAADEDCPDIYKCPIAIMPGHRQSEYPVHQARLNNYYRIVLPQSMLTGAHTLHQMWTAQGIQGPLREQSNYPGNMSAEDLRLLQAHQEQLKQQQLQQQQKEMAQKQHEAQLQQQQQQRQQQQQQQQNQATMNATPSNLCGALLKTGLGYCQRLVATPGDHCSNHRGSQTPGTPQANGSANQKGLCGECSSPVAPNESIPTNKPLPCATTHLNKCKACSNSFHPICIQLDTPRIVSAIGSYPWQCNDCKLCVVCLEAGDESTLLICDDCDRGWHMGCCDPPIKELPKGDTGDEDGGSSDDDDNNMVCCDDCNRWVHMECDGQLTEAEVEEMGKDENLKYTCPACLHRTSLLQPGAPNFNADVDPTAAALSLQGLMPPQPKHVGLLANTTLVRGMLTHKGKKLGVPVIVGSGIEYERTVVSGLLERRMTSKNRKRSQRQAVLEQALLKQQKQRHQKLANNNSTGTVTGSTTGSSRGKARSRSKSPAAANRRLSVASSTSSLSSVSYISDN
ncbi:hypothetical protein BG004_003866 [Podila humilis]|nr:hypothetical protein BG004_003866 [Podila humilis]